MNETYASIEPSHAGAFADELTECLVKSKKEVGSSSRIVKQTIFIQSSDEKDFNAKREQAISLVNDFYASAIPPTSYVGQIPGTGRTVAMEIVVIDASTGIGICTKHMSGANYVVVTHPSYKKIFAAGLTENVFEVMQEILKSEGMDFSDVVRQWNYIEKLLASTGERQNYQTFNETRAEYYKNSDFRNGYPAATGIGMNEGGFVLEFIALKPTADSLKVIPISNPVQTDAHAYTKEVLVGGVSSPKFERAKCVLTDDVAQFYISGTAAIRKQQEVGDTDIEQQTLVTIENVKNLLSSENLSHHGIEIQINASALPFLRVYIKRVEDVMKVKTVCENYFMHATILYLVADICRDGLLVELEGYASVKRQII